MVIIHNFKFTVLFVLLYKQIWWLESYIILFSRFWLTSNLYRKSIHQKLIDLYVEESKRVPLCKNLKANSQILAKLINREGLNTLVVNLYPGNEGYSLMLRGRNGYDAETIKLPYEESDLLDYIDNEELPPVLIDLLEKSQANLFYSGCVIVELRDHRRTTNNSYDTRYVMLRPTPQVLLFTQSVS